MLKLEDNIYNSRLSRTDKKLKLWRHAGIMLTYKCSAACEFCYYHCGPDKNGLIETDLAINAWQGLVDIAGNNAKVHLTGGEPFLYFDRLIEILTEAKKQKLPPADLVETNASWAQNKNEIQKKLNALKTLNINKLKISFDTFHSQFVNAQTAKNLYLAACEILGEKKVLIRWQKYLENPIECPEDTNQMLQFYRKAINEYPCRFTGRAAGMLADLVANKDFQKLKSANCKNSFLAAKGVHIDPYGNVFNGQCSGIIIANLNQQTLAQTWKQFDPENQHFIADLFSNGPCKLMQYENAKKYQTKKAYASKCHLCSDIRQFFFDNRLYKKIIGPYDCYENTAAIKLH